MQTVWIVVHRNLGPDASVTECIEQVCPTLADAEAVQEVCRDAVILEMPIRPAHSDLFTDAELLQLRAESRARLARQVGMVVDADD